MDSVGLDNLLYSTNRDLSMVKAEVKDECALDPFLLYGNHFVNDLLGAKDINWDFLDPNPPIAAQTHPVKLPPFSELSYLATPDSSPGLYTPPSVESQAANPPISLYLDDDHDDDPTYQFKQYTSPKVQSRGVAKRAARPQRQCYIHEDPEASRVPNEGKFRINASQSGATVTLPQPSYVNASEGPAGGSFMFLNLRKKGAWSRKCGR